MAADRRGMTLVEWLVLIFCLMVLLVLLIPAMHGTRRPARGNQCSTQIKNFVLAAIQYENSKGRFPGYVNDFGTWTAGDSPHDPADPNADTTTMMTHRKIGTWAVALLPWLDAQPTYEHWTQDRYPIVLGGSNEYPLSSGESGIGFTVGAAPNLAIFQCPSDPNNQATHGRNSYVCNAGMYYQGANFGARLQLNRGGQSVSIDFARSMSAANGVFNNKFPGLGRDGKPVAIGPAVTLNDFRDGQGFTMLITENLQAMPWHRAGFINARDLVVHQDVAEIDYEQTSRFTQGAVWHYEDDASATGAWKVNPVHRINGVPKGAELHRLRMAPATAADYARPSSAHVEGVNMGMADGATRFISETIDYRVYQALLTPNGSASDVPEPTFVITTELAR